jgi:hypothetical protein
MLDRSLQHPAVGAALVTAADVLGMEAVYIAGVDETTHRIERVRGAWNGLVEGLTLPRAETFCDRLLAGAPPATSDAAHDPAYRDVASRLSLGITSYAGVPLRDEAGGLIGTFCGVDRASVTVDGAALRVLGDLGAVVAAHWRPAVLEGPVVRRVRDGWQVEGETLEDLTSAMALADLLADEIEAGPRPPRADDTADETVRLRVAVRQLEHALAARVLVEQAIGVLAERMQASPRAAFERLRRAARSRGRKVHDLARLVVASVGGSTEALPPELSGRTKQ